jgi:hypothetical protein
MLTPDLREVVRKYSGDELALWLWDPVAGKAFSGVVVQGKNVDEEARSTLDHLYSSFHRFFVRPESESKAERAHTPASPDDLQVLASRQGGETRRMLRALCTGADNVSPSADQKPQIFSWVATQMVFAACCPKVPTPLKRYVSRLITVYHNQIRTVRDGLMALGVSSGEGTFRTDLRGVFHSSDASDIKVTLTGEDVLCVLSDNAHARGGRKGQDYMHFVVLMWKVIPAIELRAMSQFKGDTHGLMDAKLWVPRKKLGDLTASFAVPTEEAFDVIGKVRCEGWTDACRIHDLISDGEPEEDEESRFSLMVLVADKMLEGKLSEKVRDDGERVVELEVHPTPLKKP